MQIARELTISLSNSTFGLFPMKWQETLDPPKRPDETDLIPNEVGLASPALYPCYLQSSIMHVGCVHRKCCIHSVVGWCFLHDFVGCLQKRNVYLCVQWDKPGSQIVNMSTEFSELFTREVTKVRAQLRF